ncbi:PrsW family glutamic-type intramembrane protease [Brachybacterium tyrofermentans]|uniref:PrsW family glutamic-type intramembrane protease n=1 Tax=Brachybacterium tyrofermentans TaxID=47848 RepID=UPI003FCF1D21
MSEQPVIPPQAPTLAGSGPPPMPQARSAPRAGPAPSLASTPPAGSASTARYPWYLRFSWILALVVGTLAYVATFVIMLLTRNPTILPTVLLVGAATIPLTVLLFAQSSRVGPLVPTRTVLVTVALGGLFGICAAGLEETIAGLLLGKASILLVGVIEETAKLVVPLIVLGLAHRSTRGGGVVIGIAAGTGFAVLETMGYGFNALLSRSGGLGALDSTLILRGILVPAGHVAWTGAICAALLTLTILAHRAFVRRALPPAGKVAAGTRSTGAEYTIPSPR